MKRKVLILSMILVLALTLVPTAFAQDGGGGDGTTDPCDGTTDPGDGTGGTGDTIVPEECEEEFEHPVVARIAEELGVDYEVIWLIFTEGFEYPPGDDGGTTTPTADGETFVWAESGHEGRVGLGRIMTAARVADQLENADPETNWEDLLAWHLDGNGWGSVMHADRLAGQTNGESATTTEALLARRAEGESWGQIRKDLGLSGPPEGRGNPNDQDVQSSQSNRGNQGNRGNNGNNGNNGNGGGNGNGNNK
jgi:hypothetical protein